MADCDVSSAATDVNEHLHVRYTFGSTNGSGNGCAFVDGVVVIQLLFQFIV